MEEFQFLRTGTVFEWNNKIYLKSGSLSARQICGPIGSANAVDFNGSTFVKKINFVLAYHDIDSGQWKFFSRTGLVETSDAMPV